jgi:hypothetical protein
MRVGSRLFLFLLVSGCYLEFLAQGPSPNPQEAAANLVKMHQAWGSAASSPNATLSIREQERSGKIITFRLYTDGLRKDTVYSLVAWPVTQRGPSEALKGVTLDDSGLAVCAGRPGTCGSPDKPNDPIDLKLSPTQGEPVRLGLVSTDQSIKVFARMVPLPFRGEDRGCSVEATLLTPGSELVVIDGAGFPPNSEVVMDSNSEGERHGGKASVSSEGRYTSAILPYKQGVTRGTTTVSLKSDKCSPSVAFPWGRRN